MAQTGQETILIGGQVTNLGFLAEKNKKLNALQNKLISEGKEIVNIVEAAPISILGVKQQEIRVIWRIPDEVVQTSNVQTTVVQNRFENVSVTSENFNAIVERIFMFLEDGEWNRADYYCEQALNFNPKSGILYLGKLMAELKVRREEDLSKEKEPFGSNDNAIKASRFDSSLAVKLNDYNKKIRDRNEMSRQQSTYNEAVYAMNSAKTVDDFNLALKKFDSIRDYKDSKDKMMICLEKKAYCAKDTTYENAVAKISDKSIDSNKEAVKLFESIIDWKDSRAKIAECNSKNEEINNAEAERMRRAEEARITAKKRNKKIAMIGGPIVAALIVFLIVLNTVILPAGNYKKALAAANSGNYSEAYSLFSKHPEYKDTEEQIKNAKYNQATALLDEEKFDEAYILFRQIGKENEIKKSKLNRANILLEEENYDMAYDLLREIGEIEVINESIYARAIEYLEGQDYEAGIDLLKQIPGYKDADQKISDAENKITKDRQLYNLSLLQKAKVGDTVIFGAYEQDNNTYNGKEGIEWRVLAKEGNKTLVISEYVLDCQPYNNEYTSV